MSRSGKIVLSLTAMVGAAACAFLAAVLVGQGLIRASLWAAVLAALAGVVAAGAAVWALVHRPPRALLPPELDLPEWVVDRPREMDAAVAALARVSGLDGTQGLQGQADLGKGSSVEYYPEQCPGQSAGTAALSSFRSSPAD